MKIHLIWAQAHGGVIGANGAMPWHLPEDLAHFKRQTLGHPVIMGRKTWDSLPTKFRPLPGRLNIVLSRGLTALPGAATEASVSSTATSATQLLVCPHLNTALAHCKAIGASEVWVIGGGQVYQQALPLADGLWVTHIDLAVAGDTFAPKIEPPWQAEPTESHRAANGLNYQLCIYRRRPAAV